MLRRIHQQAQKLVPEGRRSRFFVYTLAVLGVSLDNMNTASSITTFFSMLEHFDSTTTTVSWTLSAYALTLGAMIMVSGKFVDILGANRVVLVALSCMAILALICALVENIIALIVVRAIQGVFASALIPCGFSLAGSYFKDKQLTTALSVLVLVLNSSFGLGLVLGGVFSVSAVGYKGIHYFTFATATSIVVILYLTFIPSDRTEEAKKMSLRDLDYYGSFLLVAGVLLMTLGFTEGGNSWKKPTAYVPLPIGVVVIVLAVLFEMVYITRFKEKVDSKISLDPESFLSQDSTVANTVVPEVNDWRYKLQILFPKEVLSIPNFTYYVVGAALNQIVFSALLTQQVQYWIYVTNNTPLIAAVKTLSSTSGLILSCFLFNEGLVYKVGMKWVLIFTQILCLSMTVWISRHDYSKPNNYWIYEFLPLGIYSMGGSTYFFIYYSAVFRRTPAHLQGVVSGLLSTTTQIAVSLQNSIVAAILGNLFIAETDQQRSQLSKRFENCFYLFFACLGLSVIMMLLVDNQKTVDGKEEVEEVVEEIEMKELES